MGLYYGYQTLHDFSPVERCCWLLGMIGPAGRDLEVGRSMILIHINHPPRKMDGAQKQKQMEKWTKGLVSPWVKLRVLSGSGAACDEGILGIREVVATWFGD